MAARSDAEQRQDLAAYLQSAGFGADEIAANDGRLVSLEARRVLFGNEARITTAEIAARAGCDVALVERVRLAAGLPGTADAAVCSEREVGVIESFLLGSALFGEELTLQFTRVLGSTAAAVAEAALALFASSTQADLFAQGADLVAVARAGTEATTALLGVPPVLDTLLRLQFERAASGVFAGEIRGATVEVAVGFVDLVESTRLTTALSSSELAAALTDFERAASDALVAVGGRVVKRIGDAVMFVVASPSAACDASAAISSLVAAHPRLEATRAAVAFGRLLPRDGDYFGECVNLAARCVPLAVPGTIVVTEPVRLALSPDEWHVVELGAQALKGFPTPVPLFRLERR